MIRPCAAWAKRSARFFQAGPERRRRHEGTHTSAVHHLWRGQGGDDMAHIPITAESRSIPARSLASLFQQRISSGTLMVWRVLSGRCARPIIGGKKSDERVVGN